jgi:stage III sporulation protein AF
MLALIGHWVRSLIIIVLLGNLAEFMLPKGDLKKYAGLVVGLVLLLAMVSPVWGLIHQLSKTPLPSAWLGAGNGQGVEALIKEEQLDQAEAMVMSYQNVVSCAITSAAGTQADNVTISVSGPVTAKTLRQYVEDALSVTTGAKPQIHLRVMDIPARSSQHPTVQVHS